MITITSPHLLLVEGKDEVEFFKALQLILGITSLQMIDCKGRNEIPKVIETLVISPKFSMVRAMGIVRDADENPSGAFTSICACLVENELLTPETLKLLKPLEITEQSKDYPAVGVMIMPGTIAGKMLEDLCLAAFVDDQILKCVEAYFECHGVTSHNPSKAKLTTFLAAKINEKGAVGLEKAVGRDWWPWDHKAFDEVKAFITLLTT
ncbi:MAG: hypothetical protein MUF87_13265 [Anaerolineae bacterium]|jgi:hypothetical protein|nr:hypothetical protein [Anaerolineae bacterium]